MEAFKKTFKQKTTDVNLSFGEFGPHIKPNPSHTVTFSFPSSRVESPYLSSWCSGTPGRARVAGGRSPTGAASPVRCWWPRSHTGSTGSSGCSGCPGPGPPLWTDSGWSPPSAALCCEAPPDTPWCCGCADRQTDVSQCLELTWNIIACYK